MGQGRTERPKRIASPAEGRPLEAETCEYGRRKRGLNARLLRGKQPPGFRQGRGLIPAPTDHVSNLGRAVLTGKGLYPGACATVLDTLGNAKVMRGPGRNGCQMSDT